jgi:outer membrane biosynthesis protein TonB
MAKNKEFDNILNECLERLLVGDETIEQCLVQYPEQAVELRPLLETALAAKKISNLQPSPEFKARARYQFREALNEVPTRKAFFSFVWPAWATVVAVVLAVLLSGGGTVALASNSMPDEPLYSVKVATEQVRLAFTFSDIGKAEVHAELADRRVEEITAIANRAEPEDLEKATDLLNTHLERVATLAMTWSGGEKANMLRVPAPTPAPTPEPAPAAPPAPTPSLSPAAPEPTPAPTPEPAPAAPPAPITPPAPEEATQDAEGTVDGELAKLRVEVERNAIRHPAMLREMLRTAPESAKPTLRRALEIAEARYQQALEAVDGHQWGK